MNDAELLRRYAQEGSQEAFAQLVGLRVGLVYSAALRQARGDVQWAQEVTQSVFTDLAAKASALCRHEALIGWLFTSTHYAVGKLARAERRRRRREQEAFALQEDLAPGAPEIPVERLRPLLDDAMHHLGETDRRALLLRFFDGYSMAELGRSLGLSESAAQKRVERALLKLRQVLSKRGLSSTAAALGMALAQEAAAVTAPAGLAAAVSGGALASAAAAAVGLGFASLITSPLAWAAGLVGTLVAITVGVVEYESHPALPGPAGGLPGRGVPALLAGGWIAAPPAPEAGETASVPADDRRVAAGVLPVRKPVTAAEPPDLSPPAPGPSGAGEPGMGSGWLALPSGPGSVADTLQVLDPTQVDQRPVPASRLHPNYPMEMRRRNISGEVLVDFIVDADGRVRHAVAASSSRAEFERAALEAVSGWRFSPGRKNGRPVAIHLRLPILFTLDSHD